MAIYSKARNPAKRNGIKTTNFAIFEDGVLTKERATLDYERNTADCVLAETWIINDC